MKNQIIEYSDKQMRIMEAAEELFAEKGFDGTSVRDIAEEAGVNLAMISYYFGSKEKLMESLFKYRGESIKLQLENMIENKELSSLQKVYAMIDNYIDRIMKQQCFHKILSRIQMVELKGITTQLIHEGQRRGEFKKNIDVPLMMATLVGTTSHLVTTQHYYRKLNNLESLPDEEFEKLIKKKLSHHLKLVFKAILTYE